MATPISNMTVTWNNAGTTFNAIKMNVTDTASNAASLLMDLQVGGTSRFRVDKNGGFYINSNSGFSRNGNNLLVTTAGSETYNFSTSAFISKNPITLASADVYSPDVYLVRDNAANTLGQRNATNAQTFNIYNTYTTTTNYERGFLKWNTNVLQIGTEKGSGGGTARALEFQTDGTTRLTISSLGVITSAAGYALQPASPITWLTRGEIYFNADGVAMLRNNAGGDFGRLQFGGTTSSFPALKRSSTTLQVRLADDSAFGPLEASTLTTSNAYTVATLPAAGVAGRRAYVTDATTPTFLGALTGGGAVVCPVFDNGTAWVAG